MSATQEVLAFHIKMFSLLKCAEEAPAEIWFKNPSTLAREECEKNQELRKSSWGWMHDCLQTTAEREYISQGNLITRRQSHEASCCEWVHSECETLPQLLFRSSSTLRNVHEHDVLLQFMTPLVVIFLKSTSASNTKSLHMIITILEELIQSYDALILAFMTTELSSSHPFSNPSTHTD